ncbi:MULTISPECIES: hypothetical protein [Chryseobacterium group]|nr:MULTISPECIES: hypothetical protein [Chryseobacterium group]
MNPTLLRKVLMWVAPIAIGYVMKKYEAKRAKKTQDKAMAQNAHA